MLNPFVIKKWGALLLSSLLTTISFFIGLVLYDTIGGIGFMMGGLLVGILIGNAMLNHPFRAMVEGKGILMLDLNSTGIIRPFITTVLPPYIKGTVDNHLIEDIFDRSAVFSLIPPVTGGVTQQGQGKDGNFRTAFVISEDEYNQGRFGLNHYPVVIFNSQNQTLITKEMLSENEKTSFAEHTILYLNAKVKELTTAMLNFGRYVVESTKPKLSWMQSKWTWIILIIGLALLAVIFLPTVFPQLKAAFGGAATAASSITPLT